MALKRTYLRNDESFVILRDPDDAHHWPLIDAGADGVYARSFMGESFVFDAGMTEAADSFWVHIQTPADVLACWQAFLSPPVILDRAPFFDLHDLDAASDAGSLAVVARLVEEPGSDKRTLRVLTSARHLDPETIIDTLEMAIAATMLELAHSHRVAWPFAPPIGYGHALAQHYRLRQDALQAPTREIHRANRAKADIWWLHNVLPLMAAADSTRLIEADPERSIMREAAMEQEDTRCTSEPYRPLPAPELSSVRVRAREAAPIAPTPDVLAYLESLRGHAERFRDLSLDEALQWAKAARQA
jgi:hypothetical protein